MNSFQEGFIKAATAHGIAEQPLVECMNASKETFEVITELFKQADFSQFKNQLYDTLIKNTGLEKHLDPLREAIMSRLNVDSRTAASIMAAGGGGLTGLVGSQLFDLPVLESTLLGAGAAGAGTYALADDPTKYIPLATRAAKLDAPRRQLEERARQDNLDTPPANNPDEVSAGLQHERSTGNNDVADAEAEAPHISSAALRGGVAASAATAVAAAAAADAAVKAKRLRQAAIESHLLAKAEIAERGRNLRAWLATSKAPVSPVPPHGAAPSIPGPKSGIESQISRSAAQEEFAKLDRALKEFLATRKAPVSPVPSHGAVPLPSSFQWEVVPAPSTTPRGPFDKFGPPSRPFTTRPWMRRPTRLLPPFPLRLGH